MSDPRFIGVLSLSPWDGPDPNYTGYDATIAMQVDADFSFIDSKKVKWTAPKNSVVDGANIPRFAKWVIGGSFQQPYLPAAVIHDVYCRTKVRTWESTAKMFYEAMICNGVELVKARTMWLAVYVCGPHW